MNRQNSIDMTNRLITPQLMEALKNYPLYSQDGKGVEAICVAVFQIGRIRWYVLEGQQEGDDFVLFSVVCGMCETEYGYVSANELASIEIDGAKFGMDCKFHVCQDNRFQPTKLKDICHTDLQEFLNRIYPK